MMYSIDTCDGNLITTKSFDVMLGIVLAIANAGCKAKATTQSLTSGGQLRDIVLDIDFLLANGDVESFIKADKTKVYYPAE